VRAHPAIGEPCTREFYLEGEVLAGVREKLRRIRVPLGYFFMMPPHVPTETFNSSFLITLP